MAALRADQIHRYTPVSASFDRRTGMIVTHIDKIDFGFIDRPVRYQGLLFQPKRELHITIISKDAGVIMAHLTRHPEDVEDILDLVVSTNWSFYRLNTFYYVQEKPEVETIIQMVEIPALQSFLGELSRLAGHGFLMPPTHITLYERGAEKGIAIPDQHSLQHLMKTQIQPQEVRTDRKLTNA
jgi:hypothetical protein